MLKVNDVVKIMLGVQLDGFAVTHAETIHLTSKSDGLAADVIRAAYEASQLAMRTLKVGSKNWDVTEVIEKVAKEYQCSGVEGMLSCQHERNVTDGKKRILLNPTPELKREHDSCSFEEGEVYGVDILIVTGTDGKVRELWEWKLNCTLVGQARSFPNVDLQAFFRYQLSVEDEDVPSGVFRDTEESRGVSFHSTGSSRREKGTNGCTRGCIAW